jgi:FtsZ-interacting cell division protein ZipA
MSTNSKIIRVSRVPIPPRSPIGSDDDEETNITLVEEKDVPLKETVIEHKKIDFNPITINKQQEKAPEEEEEAEVPEEEEEAEAEAEAEEEAEAEAEAEAEEEAEEEEEAEAEEEAEEAEEAEELDNNTKDFIVLCTHKYLYNQEVPSLSSNKRRQKSMERIVARHVDSICEAFRYLS